MSILYLCIGSVLAITSVWKLAIIDGDYGRCVVALLFSIYLLVKAVYFQNKGR